MNICIVSNYKQEGYGESTRPGQLAKYLATLGHNILHICDWQGVTNGIKHIQIERNSWDTNPFTRAITFAKKFLEIHWFKPDIVYIHQFNNGHWAQQTNLLKGFKKVFDAHTSAYYEQTTFAGSEAGFAQLKKQENDICHSADFIIAASNETKDILIKTYQLSPEKIRVVGNATNVSPVETITNLASSKFICLATLPQDGFKSNQLALEMLLDIAAKVYESNTQIEFHIVGGGNMPTTFTPNVFFKGYVKDLRQTILGSSLCLMPFPANAVCGGARNKFCDYIALGKTTITTPEGMRGMEILTDKKNCLVATTSQQFAAEIISLEINRNRLIEISKEVFLIKDYFNWQDRAKKVESIFQELIKK